MECPDAKLLGSRIKAPFLNRKDQHMAIVCNRGMAGSFGATYTNYAPTRGSRIDECDWDFSLIVFIGGTLPSDEIPDSAHIFE